MGGGGWSGVGLVRWVREREVVVVGGGFFSF